ncbi:hypothetical protein [Stackebrandtia nassauensis]|uniref:Uncharacterized protein n=1 Tax=Stackebrandtia nassauensis (strain DSM 44728 / CIP 108903 / NRRL B-16338 / NBRC 102104 / LLR-40K-21) TaxID=446470 RepID=D3Q236_STANL|nr:hypothetical protein [Stackebrandtia nassauensis]ADD41903.1 hypothetical protein Snas_2212 [Stackebrandtia nassauensis DSM 44728]
MGLGMAIAVGAWSMVAVIALVAAAGLYMALITRKQKNTDALEEARTDAKRWYDMLSGQLASLSSGDDPVASRALSDASERHTAAAGQLAEAVTIGHYRQVRRTATEGLRYIGAARARLGLVAGPQGPPPVAPDGRPMYEEGYRAVIPDTMDEPVRVSETRGPAKPTVRGVARLMRHQ